MAQIFSGVIGGKTMMAFWYHFAILFEALFILTTVDAGTRAARFMVQDMVGSVFPSFRQTRNWTNNLIATGIAVSMWGYILYIGVIDPFGGINTLWPLFGIANQMLAAIALILCTTVLVKMKRQRMAWVTAIPTLWLLVCTVTAGLEKVFHPNPAIGFLAQADKFGAALAEGKVLTPAKSLSQMEQIAFNAQLDAALTLALLGLVGAMLFYGVLAIRRALADPNPSAIEMTPL